MVEDRGPELAAVLGLFLGLAWLFVLLRVYVKTMINKSWALDDTLLVISLIFFTAYCACSATGVRYGTGRHVPDISESDVPKALYYWWLCEILYTITTVFIRLSIAVLLLRLIVNPVHRYIVYGTLTVVCLFSTAYFFLILFQCSPVSYFWEQYESKRGSCIDPAAVPNASIAHSAISFTADWILGLLPVAILHHLQLNRRSKISVAGLLGLGLLAGIATLVRIPFIKVLALTDDFLFATTDVAIWSTIEPGLGIVAFAGATLRPLFRSFYNLTARGSNPERASRGSRALRMQNRNRDNKGYIRDEGECIPGFEEEGRLGLEDHFSKQGPRSIINPDQPHLQKIRTNESIQGHDTFNYNFAYDDSAAAHDVY